MNAINLQLRKMSISKRLLGMLVLSILATILMFLFALSRIDNVLIAEKETKFLRQEHIQQETAHEG